MNNDVSRVSYAVYWTADIFIDPAKVGDAATGAGAGAGARKKSVINSRVVASSLNGFRVYNLPTPVYSTFKLLEVLLLLAVRHRSLFIQNSSP